MQLINYGSKIMDHTFILKGGTICVFLWLSADSPPWKGCQFLRLYTSMLCKVCWYGRLGWGGVPWHLHTNMMVHGVRWGGLITFLGT